MGLWICIPPRPQVVPDAVLKAIDRAVTQRDLMLDAPDRALHYMRRELRDASVFLFFNESDNPLQHQVTLRARGTKAEVWDPQTAAIHPLASKHTAGSVKIELVLQPYEARVVVVR